MSRMLAATLLLAGAASGETPWRTVRREPDGLTLAARSVNDTAFLELRVTASSPAPPARLLQVVWDRRLDGVEGQFTERSQTLREASGDRLLYLRLKPPVIGPRDYTIRFRALLAEDSGVARVWFTLENQSGPPPQPGVTRMRVVRGEWVFSPLEGGGSSVTYVCVSDPAGEVAVWLATAEQERIAVEMVREALARAAQAGQKVVTSRGP
jgi:hypothetical protein